MDGNTSPLTSDGSSNAGWREDLVFTLGMCLFHCVFFVSCLESVTMAVETVLHVNMCLRLLSWPGGTFLGVDVEFSWVSLS